MSVELKADVIFSFEQKCPHSNLPNCRVGTEYCTVVKGTTENIQYYHLLDKYQKRVLKHPVIGGTFSALFSPSST